MKTIIGLMLLCGSSMAFAAPTLVCFPEGRGAGEVRRVDFTNPVSSIGDFKNMIVTLADGSIAEYTTDFSTLINASPIERPQHAVFSSLSPGGGLASLEYVFFTRPQDVNPNGFSLKNGAHMKLILPQATELARLTCDKDL